MFHNMRADIIYYKTATDFELEFNLCGCCRMRLLSDKMQDKKSFVHSLARAVSRSSVILIAGPLFGQEGSIKIVADAINSTTESADNKTFGLSEEDDIQIIKGSTPLVTSEGYFGGCIIESGPQTMILLTDNKNIRKNIMQNLIHPYIEELYSNEVNFAQGITEEPEDSEKTCEDETQEEIEQIEEAQEITDLQENNKEDIAQSTLEDDNSSKEETQDTIDLQNNIVLEDQDYTNGSYGIDDEVNLYFDPIKSEPDPNENYYDSFDDDYGDDYKIDQEQKKQSKNGLSLSVFIISIILLLLVAVLCYCIFLVPMQADISPVENLQDIFKTMFG